MFRVYQSFDDGEYVPYRNSTETFATREEAMRVRQDILDANFPRPPALFVASDAEVATHEEATDD